MEERLNPSPDSYTITPFADRCIVTCHAGPGGHGCVSFHRDIHIQEGPPNGGDGGYGGGIYIQAVRGETSLHKLARRGLIKAGRGRNGQGKTQGGERGEDVLITVPVGTVVRELYRHDPYVEEEERWQMEQAEKGDEDEGPQLNWKSVQGTWRKDKWILYPGTLPSTFSTQPFPDLPPPRRSHLAASQPDAPIMLDLDKPMEHPILLAAGAVGGLGNPHFVSKAVPRPRVATRGDIGMSLSLQLELKLIADMGLVGLPNAGKSTLLRSVSNSRARVGNWAFTTLQPNIGTVVIDDHKGRPKYTLQHNGENRTNFTIADIPGLVEDAHLDRGLGLGFLRHVERAAVLAFVIDLSAGDAVAALKALWKEVSEYETLRSKEVNAETQSRMVDWTPGPKTSPAALPPNPSDLLPPLTLSPISSKPWFVVGTKADKEGTQENFAALQAYLEAIQTKAEPHPSGKKNAWSKKLHAIPVSAIRAEGVEQLTEVVVDLFNQ